MLKSNVFVVALLLLSILFPVHAGELRLDYSSFYSHLRKIDDDELRSLQFAFGFLNVRTGDLCTPQKALVHTDKKDIPVVITEQKRFVLPTEKALKLAKAEVHIQLVEANNQCDLSVLLEVKPELINDGVNAKELQDYFTSFEAFFDKMGGFLSFMMPSPEGLNLVFQSGSDEPGRLSESLTPTTKADTYTLMADKIPQLATEMTFSDIASVTAFVPN